MKKSLLESAEGRARKKRARQGKNNPPHPGLAAAAAPGLLPGLPAGTEAPSRDMRDTRLRVDPPSMFPGSNLRDLGLRNENPLPPASSSNEQKEDVLSTIAARAALQRNALLQQERLDLRAQLNLLQQRDQQERALQQVLGQQHFASLLLQQQQMQVQQNLQQQLQVRRDLELLHNLHAVEQLRRSGLAGLSSTTSPFASSHALQQLQESLQQSAHQQHQEQSPVLAAAAAAPPPVPSPPRRSHEPVAIAIEAAHSAPVVTSCPEALPLSLPQDLDKLSPYQALLRKQLELFEATPTDMDSNRQGRKKKIQLCQVGVRCRHCALDQHRTRAAVYYPSVLTGIYQAAQNMATSHLIKSCPNMDAVTRSHLQLLRDRKETANGGKRYWADGCAGLGLYETKDGLRLRRSEV